MLFRSNLRGKGGATARHVPLLSLTFLLTQKSLATLTLTMEGDKTAGGFFASLMGDDDEGKVSILVNASLVNTDLVLGYVYGGQLSEPGYLVAKGGAAASPQLRPTLDMER